MMNITKSTAVASLGLAALLLSGCTSADMANMGNQNGGGGGSSNTAPEQDAPVPASELGGGDVIAKNDKGLAFAFSGARTAPGTEPDVNGINVVIPDALKEALGKAAAARLPINGYVLTPRELEGLEYCGVDIEIDYADKSAFDGFTVAPTNGIFYGTETGDVSLFPGDKDLPETVSYSPEVAVRMAVLNLIPNRLANGRLNTNPDMTGKINDEGRSIKQLDESNPEPGAYASDDLSTLTVVTECSPNPSDEDYQFKLYLPELIENPTFDPYDRFGSLVVSVMIDGTISVAGEIDHYVSDSNGNWIAS